MSISPTLCRLAASAAAALAFSPLASVAGLLDDNNAVNRYRSDVIAALKDVSKGDPTGASLRASGFLVELEAALKVPGEKIRIVDYPPRANADLLRVTAVVPPEGLEQLPIPVCVEQYNKVLATLSISSKGEVIPQVWSGATVSDTPTSAACKAFILAARDEMNEKLAQNQPPSQ